MDKIVDRTIYTAKKGLDILPKISDKSEANYAKIYLLSEVASIYSKTSQTDNSRRYFYEALELAEEEKDTLLIGKFNNSIAFGYFYGGNYGKCKYLVEKPMAVNFKKYGPTSLQALKNYQNLAVVFTKLQIYEDANLYYEKSYELIKELKGEESFEITRLHFNIGIGHLQKEEYDKAIERFQKSLKIRRGILDPIHPDIAHSYQIIGTTLINQYKYEEALKYLEPALRIRKEIGDIYNPDMIRLYNNLAAVYFHLEKITEAEQYLDHAFTGLNYNKTTPVYSMKS